MPLGRKKIKSAIESYGNDKVTASYGKGNKNSHSILWVKTFLSLTPPLHLLLMVHPNIFLRDYHIGTKTRVFFFFLFV